MPIRIVRLGTARAEDEGLRVGTVRRPPRGVAKARFAQDDWYDVWYPDLAPSVETMKLGLAATTDKVPALKRGLSTRGPHAGPAGRAVAQRGDVGRLLLRGGIALPPRHPARLAG